MWKYFTKNLNDSHEVDLIKSLYCGDAAGRKVPKDFNDTDYKFGLNIGI